MIERLTTEAKRNAGQADRSAAAQSQRPSMIWYLDPVTGKPAARWVFGTTEVTESHWLPSAA
jgi:hypothetical protein